MLNAEQGEAIIVYYKPQLVNVLNIGFLCDP